MISLLTRVSCIITLLLACSAFSACRHGGSAPPAPRAIPPLPGVLTSYESLVATIAEIDKSPIASVEEIGRSVEGRALHLLHFSHNQSNDPWKVLLIGSQHGDEPAGKEALIVLARELAANPSLLPTDTDVYIIPTANPDGNEADKRRNGNSEDLNRDHILLSQPESLLLHQTQRRILADVIVDCHEYTRDSSRYVGEGHVRWPLIMMGGVNHPLVDPRLRELSSKWVAQAVMAFEGTDITYAEYYVGGPPPTELRLSTLDPDDARNGLGLEGNLSFIIESGVLRGSENPNADLTRRVEAYYRLLWFLIEHREGREAARLASREMREGPSPEFVPTNFFWGSNGLKITNYPMTRIADGQSVYVPTSNFMHDLIVKNSTAMPYAYAISPEHSVEFKALLERHAIPYTELSASLKAVAQTAELLRLEEEYDDVYNRYDGRQIVRIGKAETTDLPAGTLIVRTDGLKGRRAATLLEPEMMYSIYQFEPFRAIALSNKILPVMRITEKPDGYQE